MKLPFLNLKMMVKSGLEFILKLREPLQRYLLSCQANSANLGRYFCSGQQQLWRGSVNFKINSRPLFTIIFKLKNGNFMTRDFSPLIKKVLAGVINLSVTTVVQFWGRKSTGAAPLKVDIILENESLWKSNQNNIFLLPIFKQKSIHVRKIPPRRSC